MVEHYEEHGERTEEDGKRVEIIVRDHGERRGVLGTDQTIGVCAAVLWDLREGGSAW